MTRATIEILEARTLMAAQTFGDEFNQIAADASNSKATVAASVKISATVQHTLAAALKKTGKVNAADLKTLAKDFKLSLANIKAMQARANLIGGNDLKAVFRTLNTAYTHQFSTKTLAALNKALAKLSKDDNAFVAPTVFNSFYSITIQPEDDQVTLQEDNLSNATLNATLVSLEPQSNFATALYPEFNSLVEDISTLATAIVNTYPGTVF